MEYFSRKINDFYKFFQIFQLPKPHDILILIFIRKKICNLSKKGIFAGEKQVFLKDILY